MLHLSNEEIREKLLEFNYECGPVTDTTREIHLKKLILLNKGKAVDIDRKNGGEDRLTDDELRAQLLSFGQSVAPITATNRQIYIKRLKKLKTGETLSDRSGNDQENDPVTSQDDWEPMDVD